jgi:ubiquinone biosynthesis protein
MSILAIAATAVLIVLSGAAIVGAFAVLARRLLGLGFDVVRLLLAGLVGFAVAGPIFQPCPGRSRPEARRSLRCGSSILAAAAAPLVAMTFQVVAEALVPSGSLPNPLEPRRQLRGRIARARRYWQISRIAIHHGLLPYLRGRRQIELDAPDARLRLARSEPNCRRPASVQVCAWVTSRHLLSRFPRRHAS